jgi:hypothetical protein
MQLLAYLTFRTQTYLNCNVVQLLSEQGVCENISPDEMVKISKGTSKAYTKLSLGLITNHSMKMYEGGGIAPPTMALDGGEWSASRPGRFIPGEGAPGTHWVGDWVGSRDS